MGCGQDIPIVDQAATTVDNELTRRWNVKKRFSRPFGKYVFSLTIPILKQYHPNKVIYLRVVAVVYFICQGVGSASRLARQQAATAACVAIIDRRSRGTWGCCCDIVCFLSAANIWKTPSALRALGFSQKQSLSF